MSIYKRGRVYFKPATVEYYTDGAKMIQTCDWSSHPLDTITDQHTQHFAAKC